MNKRISEASALRAFFQDQWEHLQQLLEARQSGRRQQQNEAKRLASAVESIVEGTDNRLRALGDYQKRLRKSARELLDYIEGLVAGMPPAVQLGQTAYSDNALVNMLFDNSRAMHQLFSSNQPVQAFFADRENPQRQEVFALLFLNRTEKNILGADLSGEVIQKEVQQTSVSFSAHQLIAPEETEQAARRALKKTLFDSVVQHLKLQMTELRYRGSREEKWAQAKQAERNIDNPAVYIEVLVEQLSLPQKLISLQDKLLRVSKMGLKLPLDARTPSNKVKLHEVGIGGQQTRIVTLVRYPRAELQAPPSDLYF